MPESLSAKVDVKVTASLSNKLGLSTAVETLAFPSLSPSLAAANRMYSATLDATGVGSLNAYSFGGVLDGIGQPFALTKIYSIVVQNTDTHGSGSALLLSSSSSDPNGWFGGPFMSGTNIVTPGGFLVLVNPSGWDVGPANRNFSCNNSGGGTPTSFNICIFGSQ